MATATLRALERVISPRRLQIYRLPGDTDLDVLARYVWNVHLCESLYPCLQNLEISLCNSVYLAIAADQKNPGWLHSSSPLLAQRERQTVFYAEEELRKQRRLIEPDRVVAELSFGFWTSLLDVRYERIFWQRLLKPAFPHLPSRIRTRHNLSRRFNDVRRLRNRVFHHEAIWNRPDLCRRQSEILEAIEWICPELSAVTKITDRFPEVCEPSYFLHLKNDLSKMP